MKRNIVTLEPWSTKEKLCLSSAVLRSGDQNWLSVSRVLKVFGEHDRPSEWYSQKQCALQYEALINNQNANRRKKRSELTDTPSESIVRKLLQERLEELQQLMENDRKEYLRLKHEIEEIESGRADDRLDEFEREIEEEKEREAARGRLQEDRIKLESGRVTPPNDVTVQQQPQAESKVPTSPLLTSLLQSPSHYRSSPSLHSLLSPPLAPANRTNDSPTLSRLLESPSRQSEPAPPFPSPVKKEVVEEERAAPVSQVSEVQPTVAVATTETVVEEETEQPEADDSVEVTEEIKTEAEPSPEPETTTVIEETIDIQEINEMQMQEVEVEITATNTIEHEVTVTNITSRSNEESFGEKEPEQSSVTSQTLQDSDLMDDQEQHSMSELDSQMVNMIVAGSAGVISVSHDTSGDLEVTSTDIQHKDDSETAESVKDDSLDDELTERMKDEAETGGDVESNQAVEMEALNNFIIGPETPKDNYVVQVLCSTPEHNTEEESKSGDSKTSQKTESIGDPDEEMMEVGGEMVNLGGAIVDTTVHEVEVVVTPTSSKVDEDTADTPETDQQESQEEDDEAPTPKTSTEETEKDDKEEEEKSLKDSRLSSRTETKPESPNTTEDDSESGSKQSAKPRLISGGSSMAYSDSKPNSPAPHIMDDSKEYRSWKKSIMLVWNRMATHKYASMFLKPITNEQAPAYDSVIHRPVDLSTIKKRIESGELRTTVEFQRDLLLMFQNAIMYNNCRTLIWEMASIMQNECMQHLELMVDAMGEGIRWRKDTETEDKPTRGRGERGEAPKRKRTSMEDKPAVTPKRRKES